MLIHEKQNVLVIAAHPDDEVLGCGGALARHSDNGDEIHVIIISEGLTSRQISRDRKSMSTELSDLGESALNSSKVLGIDNIELLNFPDNRLDSLDRLDLVKTVEMYVSKINPSTIYTHHSGDVNIDHRRIHEAVITACRPVPENQVKTILSFEVASSTEWQVPGSSPYFTPNWFVDISQQLSRKLEALQAYSTELRPWPHPRSLQAVKHQAHWRGAQSGVNAAEAFYLLRNLQ